MADPKSRPEWEGRAHAIRSRIETIASGIRELEVAALAEAITYTRAGFHRSFDGYSGLRDWVLSCFDLNYALAGQIARIARLAAKFRSLTEAALSGRARVDAVAYAVRQLDVTGLRVWARRPYPAPVASPYDGAVTCATPEELVAQHCVHASFKELKDAIAAMLAEREAQQEAMLDQMAQESLQRIDLWRQDDGMWTLDATLTDPTGRLLDNYLKTAVPPPRQDETDADGALPAQANRNAEAFHRLLAAAGTAPNAPTRHGHTATLSLVADVDTLRGKTTGRLPRLEGEPISVPKARLLACEAGVVPMVFDYATGEVIEQSRELRLPNTALRRKLEAEQTEGCAWDGCGRPVSWCEAHHIEHWIDGGKTTPENLILLCRFHHSRIHTGDWEVTKTGPGRAVIEHIGDGTRAGDWDASADETPTGLFPTEWSRKYRRQLNDMSAAYTMETAAVAIKQARAKFRSTASEGNGPTGAPDRSGIRGPEPKVSHSPARPRQSIAAVAPPEPRLRATPASPPPILGERGSALDPIPFLPCPSGQLLGEAHRIGVQPEALERHRALQYVRPPGHRPRTSNRIAVRLRRSADVEVRCRSRGPLARGRSTPEPNGIAPTRIPTQPHSSLPKFVPGAAIGTRLDSALCRCQVEPGPTPPPSTAAHPSGLPPFRRRSVVPEPITPSAADDPRAHRRPRR